MTEASKTLNKKSPKLKSDDGQQSESTSPTTIDTVTDLRASVVAFSENAIRNNFSAIEYCKTFVSALSGSCAGIIGLTGIKGFVFYFISAIVLWLMVLYKAGLGDNWRKYFRQRQILLTNGIFDGLFTYILFWTFLYGMVHVY